MHDPGVGQALRHPLGHAHVGAQRLLDEHGDAGIAGQLDQLLVGGGPGADVDGVARVDDLGRTIHDGATRPGDEGLGPVAVGVVYAGPLVGDAAGPQHLGVERGDEAGAQEADPDRRVGGHQLFFVVKPPSTTTTAPVVYDMAGRHNDSVAWATSSGSP